MQRKWFPDLKWPVICWAWVSPKGDTCGLVQGCSSYHFSFFFLSLLSGGFKSTGVTWDTTHIQLDLQWPLDALLSHMNWSILDHWFFLSRYLWPRIRKGKDGHNWTSEYWWVSSLKLAVRRTVFNNAKRLKSCSHILHDSHYYRL